MTAATTFLQRCTTTLCACLALLAAGASRAEPVTLAFSSTGTAVHEYFVDDPVISALAQIRGTSGSWALDRDTARTVTVAGLWLGTGAAVPECCATEAHDFVFDLTVGGITQALTARVQAREISNDQYQFDILATPEVLFDLGGLGVLSLQLATGAGQIGYGQPLYESGTVRAVAQFVDRPSAVPLPGTLALVLAALPLLALQRRGRA